jgi:hypothetical protein
MPLKDLQANTVTAAKPSEVDRIRYPNIIFTQEYLDDPIKFVADSRFIPSTVVQQFPELPEQLTRDFADFLEVDINKDTPQLLTINLASKVVDPFQYKKILSSKIEFTQFGTE